MFYETWNMYYHQPFNYIDNIKDLNFIDHFHRIYEFVAVREGEITFFVNNIRYDLAKGEAILIMPHQFHSVKTEKHSVVLMLRFDPELADTFYTAYNDKVPDTNKFSMPSAIRPEFSKPTNVYQRTARIYEILGEFDAQVTKWHEAGRDSSLMFQILMCIERDFKTKCSLRDIAAELRYDYTYISKLFLKNAGITFVNYLNERRITYACHLLANYEKNITDVAHECGYSSLCSFNRNFLKIKGTTPSEFRKSSNWTK